MRRASALFFIITALGLFLWGCSAAESGEADSGGASAGEVELTVSAAASLQDALGEIKAAFKEEHSSIKIQYNFGGSGTLQTQISQGAPADLFFSASEDKFNNLVDEGLIEEGSSGNLAGNELVLITAKDSGGEIESFKDLPKAEKISIGVPESVPAGMYAKDVLESMGLWKETESRIVYAKDVRQVLAYVETGNVEAGIVYKTDALVSSKVKIVETAGEDTHELIIYPAGVISESKHLKEARLFFEFLQGDESAEILEKYGFKTK